MSRVAIFMDGAYLDFTLRDEFNSARIDYGRLSEKLAGGIDILRTYYYHCLPYQSNPPTVEESERFARRRSFYAALEKLPRYEVHLGKLEYRGRGEDGTPIFEQKRVDIQLGVDLVLLSAKHQITNAILVTGDSDFLPAVRAAKGEGVLIILYHGTKYLPHNELWQAVDERRVLTGGAH